MAIRFPLGSGRPNRYRLLLSTLALTGTMAIAPSQASANCVKVGGWTGATDDAGASGLPAVVNINKSAFQPDGTLIASGSAAFLTLGKEPYQREQVLFRCDAADDGKLYEFYSTNGDCAYGGAYEDGKDFGLPGAYRTWFKGMLIRVTNPITGKYYSRYWQSRQLTGLDRDQDGKILVKAKNFSDVKVELLRASNKDGSPFAGDYDRAQPAAYIAFKGPGLDTDKLKDGADHASNHDGWYQYWPAAVNLYYRISLRRAATCSVTTVTPNVVFPKITVAQLNQGEQASVPFDVRFQCETGAADGGLERRLVSGTQRDQTAMGLLVPAANYQSAIAEGLTTSANGVTFLLSDGYGTDSSVATGVGVALSDVKGARMNFLSTVMVTGGDGAAGWYPVLDGATSTGGSDADGAVPYIKTLTASLKKLPAKPVKPGKVYAKAQVVIRVQ